VYNTLKTTTTTTTHMFAQHTTRKYLNAGLTNQWHADPKFLARFSWHAEIFAVYKYRYKLEFFHRTIRVTFGNTKTYEINLKI
jgi:hypothetical protein